MKVFAISDFHLSGRQNKPMDIYGDKWIGHFDKIKEDWCNKVSGEDVVLIAGDISWAMALEDGLYDLNTMSDLPGKKVFIKGNHDYWWSGITTLRRRAPDSTFYFIQNDCVRFGNILIGGSRGWLVPGTPDFNENNKKIYLREAERFKLVFNGIAKERKEGDKVVCMIHHPPFNAKREDNLFTEMFAQNGVDKVVYGHLHGVAGRGYPFVCEKAGICYYLTSCDLLDFKLMQIY